MWTGSKYLKAVDEWVEKFQSASSDDFGHSVTALLEWQARRRSDRLAADVGVLSARVKELEAALRSFRSQLTARIKLCPPHSHVVYEFKAYLKQTEEVLNVEPPRNAE